MELFTAGTDGTVWNYYPDPSSDTGYRRADTGLKSTLPFAVFAAGVDQDGSVVVFARATPAVLHYRVKKPDGTWSEKVETANLPEGSGFNFITAIVARTIDGQLYVAVLGLEGSPPTVSYLATSNWSSMPGLFHGGSIQPLAVRGSTSFWNHGGNPHWGPPSKTVVFTFLCSNKFYTYDLDGNLVDTLTSYDGKNLFADYGATADVDSYVGGRDPIFMLSNQSGQYQYVNTKVATFTQPAQYSGQTKEWLFSVKFLTDQTNLTRLHAVHDHKGGTQLLCVSKDGNLYHLAPDGDSPTGYSSFGLPIEQHVTWVAVARNNDGDIEVFCAQDGANAPLIHLTLDQDTGDWEKETFEVQSPSESDDKLEEFIAYSSDILFRDSAGVPLANAAITVNASDRAMITVNNATFAVDAATSHSVTTDATGKLTITQETGGLSVPDLWLYTDKLIPAGEVLVLQQYGNGRDDPGLPKVMQSVRTRLRDVTDEDLKNAKDAKDNFLLSDSIRNSEASRKALAKAFNDCMKLPNREPPSSPAALHPLISRKGCWTGLHVEPLAIAAERSRVHPHPDLPSWSLTFGEGGVEHRRLTSQEAQAMMGEMRANAQPAADAGGNSWWSSVGDFLEALVGKFVEAVLDIKELIVDGTKAVFKFLLKGVQYVFEAALTAARDAFDLIELILGAVFAPNLLVYFFQRTFEWLGSLFDWPNILRTRDALAHIIDQMLKFLKDAGPGAKRKIDPYFADASKKIKDAFNPVIDKFGGGDSLKSFAKQNDHHDPKMAYAVGNNVVSNAVANNWQNAKPTETMLAVMKQSAADTSGLDELLKEWTVGAKANPAFASAESFFGRPASPDQMFEQGMKALLETLRDLLLGAVSGAQQIVDTLIDQMCAKVDQLRDLATSEWNIPFVKELHLAKAEAPLTFLIFLRSFPPFRPRSSIRPFSAPRPSRPRQASTSSNRISPLTGCWTPAV